MDKHRRIVVVPGLKHTIKTLNTIKRGKWENII